ncbi:hypothetical protein FBQ81_03445 [Chloroflexi bacterium CFX6]|nr:hypothetical protein [Chloroflexi bacterium CFX6]
MPPEVVTFKVNRQYSQQVVGESHYQAALERIAEDYPRRFVDSVDLYLEDDNRYDSNAVAVAVEGETVGYLPKDDAIKYRQHIEELGYPNAIGTCAGKLIGGGEGRSYGFMLDLDLDALEIQSHYTMRELRVAAKQKKQPPSQSVPVASRKPNKLLLGCLAVFGFACVIFICSAAFSGALEAINTTPTAESIITPLPALLTPTQPAPVAKSPEAYLAEYGGNLETYQTILSLTDCVLLQEKFDQASANNTRETPGAPQFQWTLGYMLAADERMQSLGCY